MFDGLPPSAPSAGGAELASTYFNPEARFCCKSAADSVTSIPYPICDCAPLGNKATVSRSTLRHGATPLIVDPNKDAG
jgi:hypothetical protein